ncbi:MAG: ribosome maturation factor RimP [Candidatus Krumholzibacteria bacterium]|nr:ribosome maturation factor RimP [Candidatus Krumholzibacteria bacterium]
MSADDALRSVIEREVEMLGYELVRLDQYARGRRSVIRIFIDEPERAVSIDDCVRVTRALGLVLDASSMIAGPYNLEVSSPGIDRPLTRAEHFVRFAGHGARIEYADEAGAKRTVIGELAGISGGSVRITVGGAGLEIPLASVLKANLHGETWEIGGKQERPKRGRRDGR